jgi:hypothetical protein
MIFVLFFVVGMLLIPVMIDTRAHPGDNILRRSDRDLLEFKLVAPIVQRIPPSVRDAFPGAAMLSLLLGLVGTVLLAFIGVFALIGIIIPLFVGLLTAAFNAVAIALLWSVGEIASKVLEHPGVDVFIVIVAALLLASRRAGKVD